MVNTLDFLFTTYEENKSGRCLNRKKINPLINNHHNSVPDIDSPTRRIFTSFNPPGWIGVHSCLLSDSCLDFIYLVSSSFPTPNVSFPNYLSKRDWPVTYIRIYYLVVEVKVLGSIFAQNSFCTSMGIIWKEEGAVGDMASDCEWVKVAQLCFLWPQGLYSPWNSPGQNTRVGSLSLLQGIFPTQVLNPCLPHCRQILHQLSHNGNDRMV